LLADDTLISRENLHNYLFVMLWVSLHAFITILYWCFLLVVTITPSLGSTNTGQMTSMKTMNAYVSRYSDISVRGGNLLEEA